MLIEELEQKIEAKRHDIHSEYQRGAIRDDAKIANLTAELNELTAQLDELQRTAQHEERVEESTKEIAYIMDNLIADDVSMRELCKNESSYQLLRTVVQETMIMREQKLLDEIKSTKEQLDAAKAEKAETQKQYDDLYEISAQQIKEINSLKAQVEDAESKRDAAAAELEEAKTEIARLNSQVDDLRQEMAVGAVNVAKVVSVQEALADYKKQKQAEEAAKPAIYDVQPLDNREANFEAKYAETGEKFTFNYLERGKYKEVTAQEAEVFRAEYLAKQAKEQEERNQADLALDASGSITLPSAPQFQDEDDTNAVDGLDQTITDRTMETETTGSVEERIQALEKRVAVLEQNNGILAAS